MPKNQAICQFVELALPMTAKAAPYTQDYPQKLWSVAIHRTSIPILKNIPSTSR
jgi:hypothetical protein